MIITIDVLKKHTWFLIIISAVFSLLTGCSLAGKRSPKNCPFDHKDIKQLEVRHYSRIIRKNTPRKHEENRDAQGRLLFWIDYGHAVSPSFVCMVCEYGYYSQLDAWGKRCKTADELWMPVPAIMSKMAMSIPSLMPGGLLYWQMISNRTVVEMRVQGWCSASIPVVMDSFSTSVETQGVLSCETTVLSNGLHEVKGSLASETITLDILVAEKFFKGDIKTLIVIKDRMGKGAELWGR